MKKYILAIAMLTFSATTFSGSTLDCSDMDKVGQDEDHLEQCAAQADSDLNKAYKELRSMHKDNEEKQAALKDMQLGWIKMRDAQCLFKSMNTASGAALTGVLCEVEMTTIRAQELADM